MKDELGEKTMTEFAVTYSYSTDDSDGNKNATDKNLF